jgi:hypothetical protein
MTTVVIAQMHRPKNIAIARQLRMRVTGFVKCPCCGIYSRPYSHSEGRAHVPFYYRPWTCVACGAALKRNAFVLTLPLSLAASFLVFGVLGSWGYPLVGFVCFTLCSVAGAILYCLVNDVDVVQKRKEQNE